MRTYNYIIIVIAIALGSCSKNKETPSDETASSDSSNVVQVTSQQYKSAGIRLGTITERPIGTTLALNGNLDVPPQNLVSISAPLGGFVKSTKLLQGMKIRKGEVLVTMENPEYIQLQQDYLDNASKLEFLEAEYKRQEELSRENVNAKKTLQQAKSQYHSMKAIVNGLKAKLSMINIAAADLENGEIRKSIDLLAPIDGFVTVVNVNVGQYVNSTDVMFKLVNIDHIHAELQLYEKDINAVKVGQKVKFKLNHETTQRTATVYLIGKEISHDRTVRIHCHLDKEDESLLPGMYITAVIHTGARNAPVLPAKAIVGYAGKEYVFVQAGGDTYKMVEVKSGNTNEEYTEIINYESMGDSTQIVVDGAYELLGLLKNKEAE